MKRILQTIGLLAGMLLANSLWAQSEQTLQEIYIRDPFILPDTNSQTYYMYRSSTSQTADGKPLGGVEVFQSKDLKHWEGPKKVCTLPDDNWIHGAI
ncbi:hypothetical protein JQM84_11965 [Parabacteroides distasonis]|nr:hypothetical protein [Parabacteroides distasonis]